MLCNSKIVGLQVLCPQFIIQFSPLPFLLKDAEHKDFLLLPVLRVLPEVVLLP